MRTHAGQRRDRDSENMRHVPGELDGVTVEGSQRNEIGPTTRFQDIDEDSRYIAKEFVVLQEYVKVHVQSLFVVCIYKLYSIFDSVWVNHHPL